MEDACHELDLKLSASRVGGLQGGASFDKHTSTLREWSALKDEAEKQREAVSVCEQLSTYLALTLPEANSAIERVRHEAQIQRSQLLSMVTFAQVELHTYIHLPVATLGCEASIPPCAAEEGLQC